MAGIIGKAKDQVVEALSQATSAVSLDNSGQSAALHHAHERFQSRAFTNPLEERFNKLRGSSADCDSTT